MNYGSDQDRNHWSRRFRPNLLGRLAALAVLGLGTGASASPIRIMPLGDSITWGFEGYGVTPDPGGYRGTLYRDLTGAGFDVQFVGSLTTNPDSSLPASAQPNEGHVGYVIDGRGIASHPGLAENLDQWLGPGGADPNLILLMIGTNNTSGFIHSQQGPFELAALITRITELRPQAKILVSTLIPATDPGAEGRVQEFNRTLSGPGGVIAQLQKLGEKVTLVNIGSQLTTADLIDGVHPNPGGYTKLGHAWFRAVQENNALAAPEPSTFALLGCGALGSLYLARVRARKDKS